MNHDRRLLSKTLSSLGAEVCHKLSTSNCNNICNRYSIDKLQMLLRTTLKTPVIVILYNISNICDSARFVVLKWRNQIRLLSLGWSLDGHSPYSVQVLQASLSGGVHAS